MIVSKGLSAILFGDIFFCGWASVTDGVEMRRSEGRGGGGGAITRWEAVDDDDVMFAAWSSLCRAESVGFAPTPPRDSFGFIRVVIDAMDCRGLEGVTLTATAAGAGALVDTNANNLAGLSFPRGEGAGGWKLEGRLGVVYEELNE